MNLLQDLAANAYYLFLESAYTLTEPCHIIKVVYTLIDIPNQFVYILGLNNIIILSYMVILKCHDNQYQREIFGVVISAPQYYYQYRGHHNIYCSKALKISISVLVILLLLAKTIS